MNFEAGGLHEYYQMKLQVNFSCFFDVIPGANLSMSHHGQSTVPAIRL